MKFVLVGHEYVDFTASVVIVAVRRTPHRVDKFVIDVSSKGSPWG